MALCVVCNDPIGEERAALLDIDSGAVAHTRCVPDEFSVLVDNSHRFAKREPDGSSCLEWPEFLDDRDFFDYVGRVGLDV